MTMCNESYIRKREKNLCCLSYQNNISICICYVRSKIEAVLVFTLKFQSWKKLFFPSYPKIDCGIVLKYSIRNINSTSLKCWFLLRWIPEELAVGSTWACACEYNNVMYVESRVNTFTPLFCRISLQFWGIFQS